MFVSYAEYFRKEGEVFTYNRPKQNTNTYIDKLHYCFVFSARSIQIQLIQL